MTDHRLHPNHRTLFADARAGNSQACRRVFEAYVEPLFRFLRQFSRSEDELDEWVQRSFIHAFERLDQFDVNARFEPWLFQIGINEMRMDRRRAAIIPFVSAGEEHPNEARYDEQFVWSMTLRDILASLEETRRMVFTLYEVEGFSHLEIGRMLGITESHSRTILVRTKQQLRAMLDEERKAL